MKKFISIFLFIILTLPIYAQKANSPYEWNWKKDGPWLGLSLAGSAYGLNLIINKDDITEKELMQEILTQNDINVIDRWAAGNYNTTAGRISDVPFYASFAAPLVLFFNDEVNDNSLQVIGMFLESMGTTGTLYGLSVGYLNRSRPYVYSDETPMDRRLSSSGQRSFFSGHTAATATATFFVAQVYSDFNPDSTYKHWVWIGAATLPAAVGFLRIEAGQHFLTDVLVGYAVGAASGILTPRLHRKKERNNLTLDPTSGIDSFGNDFYGLSLKLKF